jgi:hypothetical protein
LFPGSGGRGDEPDARRDGPEELVCRHHENVPSFLNKEKGFRWWNYEYDRKPTLQRSVNQLRHKAQKTKRRIATF